MYVKTVIVALFASSTLATPSNDAYPTVIFHGFGDACGNPGMAEFTKEIADQTGAHAECIEIGNGAETSIFENFETQAEDACNKVKSNSNFANTRFNVVGLSQGSLIARYVAQLCDTKEYANNLLSIGGPNMGVDATPHCFSGIFCNILNYLVKNFVYFKAAQNMVGPAGYFRDHKHVSEYLKDSVFLPYLNNEKQHDKFVLNKDRFTNLDSIMLVEFTKDTMIYPKETALFGAYDADGKLTTMEDQDLYKSDAFGLKTKNEAGKVKTIQIEGDHLRFSKSDITGTFVPFLKNGITN